MRLCVIANPNSIHTRRWVGYFAARGHEVHLVGEHRPAKAVPAGVTFHDLTAWTNVRKLRYAAWVWRVRSILRQIRPDVLHAFQVSSAGWLGAAAGFHPFWVSAWGSDLLVAPQRSWLQRRLARQVLRRADYVSGWSQGLAQAARALGVNPERLEVAIPGVDTDTFHPGPPDPVLRTRMGLGSGPVVLSLRSLRSIYRPLDIARAIPHILSQVPTAQFVVLGYGQDLELVARFRAIVEEGGAAGAVQFVEELPGDQAIAELCRLADVALSVPTSDGTPHSVLEALACGVPMVLSDLPALHEWVQGEREALFVPVGDAEAIARATVRLLSDDRLRTNLRTHAAELVRERADAREWMKHAEETYRRLATEPLRNAEMRR